MQGCDSCVLGVVPSEAGLDRCDDCKIFTDDDEARERIGWALRTLIYANAQPNDSVRRAFRLMGIDPRPIYDMPPEV